MTRNTAREIAVHLAYELSFSELPVDEFLDQQLSPEVFADLAGEYDLYNELPNEKRGSISAVWSAASVSMRRSWIPTLKNTPRAGALSASAW